MYQNLDSFFASALQQAMDVGRHVLDAGEAHPVISFQILAFLTVVALVRGGRTI